MTDDLDEMDEADIEQEARDHQFDVNCDSCGGPIHHPPLWNCELPAHHTAIPTLSR